MALQSTRLVFRVSLSNVDGGVERDEESINVARHPSETQAHVILRVLARCLFWEEGLEFGPGLSTPDAPDLWAHDLTGRLTRWIECRFVDGERLKKVVNGSGARRDRLRRRATRAARRRWSPRWPAGSARPTCPSTSSTARW